VRRWELHSVMPQWLTLSYLYDTSTLRVRQTEASFASFERALARSNLQPATPAFGHRWWTRRGSLPWLEAVAPVAPRALPPEGRQGSRRRRVAAPLAVLQRRPGDATPVAPSSRRDPPARPLPPHSVLSDRRPWPWPQLF